MLGNLFLPAPYSFKHLETCKRFTVFLFLCLCFSVTLQAQTIKAGIGINGQLMANGQTVKVCIGTTIRYEDSTQRASTIFWRFKNGTPNTSTNFEPVVTYNTAGTDTTFQQVVRGTDTATAYILIKVGDQKPAAGFSFTPNNDCGSTPVTFKDTSKGNGLQYLWLFDDGDSSRAANPSHAFLNSVGVAGTKNFNVSLQVTNDQNCTSTVSHMVTVKKIPDASMDNAGADVSLSLFNGQETFKRCASLPSFAFQFRNNSSTIAINKQYKIEWGEGSPDSVFTSWPAGTVISHIFPIGKSIMKLTVLGENGCIAEKSYIVFLGTTPAGSLGNNGENSICARSSLDFPLHDFAGNASGTTYRFAVNDGTPSNVYQHPPPDTISHFFGSGSCTFYSDGYTNAFAAKLFIENPCGSSSSQIVPLYVSGKPRANLDIYPYYNICVNTAATISNASSFGGLITTTGGTGSTCTNTGKLVWKISPSTGYTITSGKLGDLRGNVLNSTNWDGATSTVNLVFNTPGIYSVKVYAGNDHCGVDSLVKEVCVRLPPQSKFSMNKQRVCSPDTVLFTNQSSAPSCLGDNYRWEVAYSDPANCGNNKAYSFVSGTSAVTKDAAIRFEDAGRYIVKLTVSANGTYYTCNPAVYQDTIWVKTKPTVKINTISARCLGNTLSPIAVVSNCYGDSSATYKWTFAGGTPATSNDAAPVNIQYPAIGNYLVKVDVANECGITSDTDTARITSNPVARAGRDTSICSGEYLQLGAGASPGISYKWTPATGLSNATIANPTVTATYDGVNSDTTLVFAVTASAGSNCNGFDTVKVIVRKKPVVLVQAAANQLCMGNSTTIIASGAGSFNWSPVAGLDKANGDTVKATPATTTTYSATGLAANGCSASASATITVIPYVNVAAGADTTVCSTTTAIQLNGMPANGTWSGNNVTPGGNFNSRAAGLGNHVLYYTAGNSGCLKTDSLQVTVITAPNAFAGADTTVCQSDVALTLKGSPLGGRWSNSTLITANGQFTPATPGTYALIYTFGGGTCVDADTIVVSVAGGITNNTLNGNQEICTGTAAAEINGSSATGGNGPVAYQWQASTDSAAWLNLAGATLANLQPGNPDNTTWYRRVATTQTCNGINSNESKPVKITVRPNATAEFTPTATIGCAPFNITPQVINLTNFGANIKEYRWLVNGNYIGSGLEFPGFVINLPGDSATISLKVFSAYGCKNDSTQHKFFTIESAQPAFTQSDTAGCGPLTLYFTNTTPNRDNYTYLWNFGQGETSTLAQPDSIHFKISPNYGDTTYTITLKTISACDTLITRGMVKVRAHPKALFTPNVSEGCSPLTVTFSNTSYGSNAEYTWDFGDGLPRRQTNADTVQHHFEVAERTTYNVKLFGSNDCGTDSLKYAIVVKPNTIRLDFAINGNQRFGCAPDTIRFINNTKGANSFSWDFGDGNYLNTSKGIDTVEHIYANAGTYKVLLKASNGCSDTTDTEVVTLGVRPKVAFNATPTQACVSENIRFVNNSDPGLSFTWSFGDGTASSIAEPVKNYRAPGSFTAWLTGSRNYSEGFTCSDSSYANLVIVDTLAGTFTVSDSVVNCVPSTVMFKANVAGSTSWYLPGGSTSSGDSTSYRFDTPGEYTVVMVTKAASGCIYKAQRTIQVNAPSGSLVYNSGYTCVDVANRFEVKATGANKYTYIFGDGDTLTTVNTVISHNYAGPGIYVPAVYLEQNGCRVKLTPGDSIKVDAIKPGFATSSVYNCGSTTLRFNDTSYTYFPAKSWLWNFGDGTNAAVVNPEKIYGNDATNYVELTVTGASGCSAKVTQPVNVLVHNLPVADIGSDSVACTGQSLSLAALLVSKDSVINYQWNFGNGNVASGKFVTTVFNNAQPYTVQLIATTIFGCADTVYKQIVVHASPLVNAGADQRICKGKSTQLKAFGSTNFQWSPIENLSCSNCQSPIANPSTTTQYIVTGTNAAGCSIADTVTINVVQPFDLSVSNSDTICIGQQTQLFATGADSFRWFPATGLSSDTVANPVANPLVSTRYRVIAGDAYQCFSDTGYVWVVVGQYPTVEIGTGGLVVAGTVVPFEPVTTNGPIRSYSWSPSTDLSCDNCARPKATINNNITYRVLVSNIYGCTASDTISYTVQCEDAQQVFIPNAFSPDGDNLNDVFMVRGKGVATVKYFRVFNRWGELVFERNNFSANDPRQGWDGRVNGKPASPDVYVYTAEVLCTAGGTFVRKGNVTLFR